MPRNKRRSKTPKRLSKSSRLGFALLGGLVGLFIIYMILARLLSAPSEEVIKMVKQSERVSAGLVDYVDGLPQTQNAQLKKLFDRGFSLYETGEHAQAIYSFNSCLELKTEDDERVALLILNGNNFILLGNLRDAEIQFRWAVLSSEGVEDKNAGAAAWGNLGVTYQKMGSLDSAEAFDRRALDIYQALGNREAEAIQLGNLGLISQTKGDLYEAFG
nr:tetratricopeptide repeat protein [candidate division Zixibacteria bacterium]